MPIHRQMTFSVGRQGSHAISHGATTKVNSDQNTTYWLFLSSFSEIVRIEQSLLDEKHPPVDPGAKAN